jgi:hypothetical protein
MGSPGTLELIDLLNAREPNCALCRLLPDGACDWHVRERLQALDESVRRPGDTTENKNDRAVRPRDSAATRRSAALRRAC